jgi:c-di-GMP-binding flagellar brake protein YcgR
MRPLGDRRSHLRLEVVGSLWGTLEIDRLASMVNISRSGALVVSWLSAPVNSVQTIKLVLGEREFRIQARVRHVRPAGDEQEPLYQLGLEFLHVPPALAQVLE